MHLKKTWAIVTLLLALRLPASGADYVARDLYQFQLPAASGDYFSYWEPLHGGPAAAGGQVVCTRVWSGYAHAYAWSSANTAGVDLLPAGSSSARVNATNGISQVGCLDGRPVVWTGSANSYTDLTPIQLGYYGGELFGINTSGSQQVGRSGAMNWRAIVWNGTAQSAVDLHPRNAAESWALGTDGACQVGSANFGTESAAIDHAMLWRGSAASGVDLNPATFAHSYALGVGGNQQVGWGYDPNFANHTGMHAILWKGTPNSYVDLNPTNLPTIAASWAYATDGVRQVGAGGDGWFHALVWRGAADTAIDLHTLLPATFAGGSSEAFSIDSQGNIYGIAWNLNRTSYHAIKWEPIPEPSGLLPAGIALLTLWRRRNSTRN